MNDKESSLFEDFFPQKPVTVAVRLQSMLLDHVIMSILLVPIILIDYAGKSFRPVSGFSPIGNYLFVVMFAIYLSKDCIAGRSLAKRILKLQVVDNKTGKAATPIQCLLRNILIFIWIVEVVVILVNPERRLGDRLAGTKVVYFNPNKKQENIHRVQIAISFILALLICFALLWWA